MTGLDARGLAVPQIGAAVIARYNESPPGSRWCALVDDYGPALRMWLLEAGARRSVERVEGGWRIDIERGLCPAQGSIPGVHHLVTDGSGNVWTCERCSRVARIDDTLAVFDAQTLERVALLATERYAHGLDVSPDSRHVVATGFFSDCLRVYDARTFADKSRISVGLGFSHTAFLSGGATAYVGCSVSDHVAVVDMERAERFAMVRINHEVVQ